MWREILQERPPVRPFVSVRARTLSALRHYSFLRKQEKGCKGEMIAPHAHGRFWKNNLMYEELPQESHAQCMSCNRPLRLVAVLAPALGEPGRRIFSATHAGTTSGSRSRRR